MKIVFFEADERLILLAEENFSSEYRLIFTQKPLTPQNAHNYADAEVVSVFMYSYVPREVLDAMPALKCIAARSTGYDYIDSAYAQETGVVVSYVPAYASHAVAEFTFGLMISLMRKINQASQVSSSSMNENYQLFCGMELYGKTLGVIGVGNIGKQVARVGRAFGMNVIAYDPCADEDFATKAGCSYLPFKHVLAEADILTLHVPCSKETYHMLNLESIGCMKQGAYLINTARGGLVEIKSLVHALLSGRLAGAACDVLEYERYARHNVFLSHEKIAPDILSILLFNNLFKDLKNTLVTPHIAFCSKEAVEKLLLTTISNVKAFLEGNPQNCA